MSSIAPTQLSQEKFAQREPLTVRLRGLVRSYPKGVGLIQEFLQNADDAGARSLRVFFDNRSYPAAALPAAPMAALQGPALVVINDALFSESDWNNIQQIGESGKALDATKTGRFGLGFNSVYNVTDFPMLLTGSRIGIFDPHGETVAGASAGHPGNAWRLDPALWSLCPDLLAPFLTFGLHLEATEFKGTAFRLPLRTTAQAAKSEICKQPFTKRDFKEIVEKLRSHIGDLLLFLKNIHDIDIFHIDDGGTSRLLLSAHTVNTDAVHAARARLREVMGGNHELLLDKLSGQDGSASVSEFEHEIDVVDMDGTSRRDHYLVVSGLFADPDGQVLNCARQMLMFNEKAVPLAGAAAKLMSTYQEKSEGHLFCSLPLPIASPMRGCHVNGFFDLQADRQGLFQDPGAGGSSAVRVNWNRLLLEHCCAQAAALLCSTLSRRIETKKQSVYEHWPRVPAQESSILDSLPRHIYTHLRSAKCIAAGADSTWCLPKDVHLLPAEANEEVRVALLSDVFLLPNPVLPDFVASGFFAAEGALAILTPAILRKFLRVATDLKCRISEAPRACLREPAWVVTLFEFCVSDGNVDDLFGVPLAHMSDETLRVFGKGAPICLGGAKERAIFSSMLHWFIHPPLQALGVLKESKTAGVISFSAQRVVNNLSKVLPRVGSKTQIKADSEEDKTLTETWLRELFVYLTDHADELKLDRELAGKLRKFPIIPDQFGILQEMGTAETPLLPGAEDSKALLSALSAFHVPIVTGGEKLLRAIRNFADGFPDMAVWRLTPRDLIDTLHATTQKESSSDRVPSLKEVGAILDYLASPRAIRDLKDQFPDRIDKLRSLRLFPTSSGQLVSLEDGDHYIPTDFDLPEVTVEVGALECGRNQRWKPLYHILRVPALTRSRLLTKVLLPGIKDLNTYEVYRLLFWTRTNLHAIREEETEDSADEIVAQLSEQLPIQCTDGQRRPPSSLYHPDSTFAAPLLGNGIGFPDLSVYKDRSDLWLDFFETLGMVRSPRPEHIVATIDTVLASEQDEEQKAGRLSEIAEYVDQHWEELNEILINEPLQSEDSIEWRLSDALSTRAWLPALRSAPRDYPVELLAILTSSFFKPSEMLARTALNLAGSVRPICRFSRVSHIQDAIGLQTQPTLEDLLTHFENALQFAAKNPNQISESLVSIFNRIYDFLGRHFETEVDTLEVDPDVLAIRQRFDQKPCIIDANRHLWPAKHCFADVVSNFLGRRARVRATSENVDHGLRVLGRRDRPDATDYAFFFKELGGAQKGHFLPEPDRPLLRSAYHVATLFGDRETFLGCPILLDTGVLVEPTAAVLNDAPWLFERAAKAGLMFMDPNLGQSTAVTFGVQLLSSAVYELPEKDHPSGDTKFLAKCEELQMLLRSPEMFAGVYRLLKASDATVREHSLSTFFKDLSVIAVSKLETNLVWTDGDLPIDGSTGPCDVVFDHFRNAIIISEEADDVLYERVGAVLANELRIDDHDLGESVSNFVAILRVEASAIDRHLTKLRVRMITPESLEILTGDAEDFEGFIDTFDESSEYHTEADSSFANAIDQPEDVVSDANVSGTFEPKPREVGDLENNTSVDFQRSGTDKSTIQHDGVLAAGGPKTDSVTFPNSDLGVGEAATLTNQTPARSDDYSDAASRHSDQPHTESQAPSVQPVDLSRVMHKSRSHQSEAQGGRARTYVTPFSKTNAGEDPERQKRRRRVDEAAIRRVLKFESEHGRNPKEMPHLNHGYDIESYLSDGQLDRFIEVKGLSGPWTDLGVAVSREQYRKACKEGKEFWLYVVEFALEPSRARIHAIQDPAELVDEYWFDGGWRALGTERSEPATGIDPSNGSLILLDGKRRATVTNIQRFGVLMRLEIEFDDKTKDQVVYNPTRIQVLHTNKEEESQK